MRILVLGGKGKIGKALNRIAKGSDVEVIVHGKEDTDIRDKKAIRLAIENTKCDCVVNCAELNDIDTIEHDSETSKKSIDVNIYGVRNILEEIDRKGIKFIQISSNMVLVSLDEYNTTKYFHITKYGNTKKVAEEITRDYDGAMILRVQDVYGDGYNLVKRLDGEMEKHSMMRVVNDQLVAPISADRVAMAIIKLAQEGKEGTYQLRGKKLYTRYELAEYIREKKGRSTYIESVSSDAYMAYAKRPKRNILDISSEFRDIMCGSENDLDIYIHNI